jgi:RNA polymerase sigma factor (TIGR02999 family)
MNDTPAPASHDRPADPESARRMLLLVYDELRHAAARMMAQEKPGQTLTATALVHEVYLRLLGKDQQPTFDNRRHFFVAAAEAMRRILVEAARRKGRHRHGGQLERVDLDDSLLATLPKPDELLAVDDAVDDLANTDPLVAQLVKLHVFAGLTLEEAARILEIAPRTAYRQWAFARAWLFRNLRQGQTPPAG